MSVSDFSRFEIYEQMCPFGERRQDLQFGMLMSLLANIHKGPKNQKEYTAFDFMLPWEPKPEVAPQTTEDQVAIFKMFAEAHNARESEKNNGHDSCGE